MWNRSRVPAPGGANVAAVVGEAAIAGGLGDEDAVEVGGRGLEEEAEAEAGSGGEARVMLMWRMRMRFRALAALEPLRARGRSMRVPLVGFGRLRYGGGVAAVQGSATSTGWSVFYNVQVTLPTRDLRFGREGGGCGSSLDRRLRHPPAGSGGQTRRYGT